MATPYHHREIELKWRKEWENKPVNVDDGKKQKYYCLDYSMLLINQHIAHYHSCL